MTPTVHNGTATKETTMRMYTNSSNARRAAKSFVDQHADVLEVATPIRAPSAGMAMFYPTAMLKNGIEVGADLQAIIDENIKVVKADEFEEPEPKAVKAKAAKDKPKAKRVTMTDKAFKLMSAPNGATAEKLMHDLGWQAHTVRGFVSLANKKRRAAGEPEIVTERKDGVTRYSL